MGLFVRLFRSVNPWAYVPVAALLLVCGGLVFYRFAFYVNTSPSQCGTCHPLITSLWKQSVGHPADKVSCHECHAVHIDEADKDKMPFLSYYRDRLFPEKYMASTERVEFHCLGCHKDIPAAATEKRKLIKINHKAHLEKPIVQEGREIKLGCVDCHANIAHDKAEEETNRPPMLSCFVAQCHMKERNKDFCERCHYQKLEDLKQNGVVMK